MPEENEPKDISPQPRRRRTRKTLRNAGATITAAAALFGGTAAAHAEQNPPPKPNVTHAHKKSDAEIKRLKAALSAKNKELARESRIAQHLLGVSAKEAAGEGLKSVDQLAGYNKKISKETRSILVNSTVQLMNMGKNETGAFHPDCTGTKIIFKGQPYVLSAGHCFIGNVNVDYGQVDGWPAQNITNGSSDNYAVGLPGDTYPLALGDAVSYELPQFGDLTLLRVQPNSKGSSPNLSQFDEIPGVNLDKQQQRPLPGEQVGLFSDPQANNFQPVMDTGRYLGRAVENFTDSAGMTRSYYLDLVGIDPRDPKGDACNFGSSGSMAVASNGYLFGPLSWRQSIGYESGVQNYADNTLYETKQRLNITEKQLGIDMSQFATICGYQVINHSSDPQKDSLESLVEGFDHFAPIFVPQSGGPPLGGK